MDKSKQRTVSEENGTFNGSWRDSFAFTADKALIQRQNKRSK